MNPQERMNLVSSTYDEENQIWSGAKAEKFYHPDVSIGQIIFQCLNNHPNNVLQISDTEGTTMTNSDVLTAAKRIAQHLRKMGLTHNDVIGIVARNTTYVLPLFVACVFNCTPFHAVNPSYDEKSFRQILGITKPKLIFCDGQEYEKIRSATQSFQPTFYTLSEHLDGVPKVLDLLEPTQTELTYKPESLTLGGIQTMAILCSSGTTGFPKAICLSNARLLLNLNFLSSEDVIYCFSGIEWFTGVWVLIANCVNGSTHIISNKPFSPEYFLEIIQKYKVNFTFLTPRRVIPIIKCANSTAEKFASLRFIASGSCPITLRSMNTLRSLAKNASISFTYGSTEIGRITANLELDNIRSVGKLSPGIRARIVDESGKNLGPQHIGEIYIDNGLPWLGYYNNPKESEMAYDSECWFHTGDVGYFDENHKLYIVDRKKDILKYDAFHFWPSEIEDCIIEIPQVEEVCVVGIYDESIGDKVGALVVKSNDSELSGHDIESYVAKKLVLPHKQLHAGVLFVESLPRNFNGKIDKIKARALLLASLERGEV